MFKRNKILLQYYCNYIQHNVKTNLKLFFNGSITFISFHWYFFINPRFLTALRPARGVEVVSEISRAGYNLIFPKVLICVWVKQPWTGRWQFHAKRLSDTSAEESHFMLFDGLGAVGEARKNQKIPRTTREGALTTDERRAPSGFSIFSVNASLCALPYPG